MEIVPVVLGALLGALVVVAVAAVVVRSVRREAAAEREAAVATEVAAAVSRVSAGMTAELAAELAAGREQTVDALVRQLAVEREQAMQATVDTVLAVAGDKLGSQSALASQELDLRSRSFDAKVADMNAELQRVGQLVVDLQKDKAQQHGQLVQGINEALRASAALTDTTQSLREALSNSRARGQWGERMADDVLRAAGFLEGVNYRKQQTLAGGGRPDVTFLLPRDRVLHMDVKFPIDNYLRHLDADRDDDRDAAAKAFLRDVRSRIKELTTRDYSDPDTTVGYVLLFIPNESVYGFIHEYDPLVLDDALSQHVVLCSPCTLFAVLGVVRQAVDTFLLSRTSDEILECLNGFTKQWVAFSDRLDKLGNQFATAQRSYDELAGPRRNQLQKQLGHIDRLRSARQLDGVPFDPDGAPLAATDAARPDLAPPPAAAGSGLTPVASWRGTRASGDTSGTDEIHGVDDLEGLEDVGADLPAVAVAGEALAAHPARARRVTRLRPLR